MINVTAIDMGTFPEGFFLFVTATNTSRTTIAVQYLSLGAGQAMKVSVAWNSSQVKPAKYTISASIPPVNNEIVTGDNMLTGGWIHVVSRGDVNYDGAVNIVDLAIIAAAYGTHVGQPNYNPQADLDMDGLIARFGAGFCYVGLGVDPYLCCSRCGSKTVSTQVHCLSSNRSRFAG